jgi:hypothetical protein
MGQVVKAYHAPSLATLRKMMIKQYQNTDKKSY